MQITILIISKSFNYLFSGRFSIEKIEQTEYKITSIAESNYYNDYKKLLDGNLKFFPIPKYTAGEYLNEIISLRSEMLNILYKSIEQGKHEGALRPDVIRPKQVFY